MNKILALFLCFILLYILPASAQETLSFYDDFIDNRHNWDVVDNTSISTSLVKGKYLFQNKETGTSPWIFKDIFLDPNKDFIIESLITQTGGLIDKGYGLVWGLDHGDNYYGFMIASNGHYKVEENIGGTYTVIQPRTK